MKRSSLKLRLAEWVSYYSETAVSFAVWFLPLLLLAVMLAGMAFYAVHHAIEHGVVASARALVSTPGGRFALGGIAVFALALLLVRVMHWAEEVLEEEQEKLNRQTRDDTEKARREIGL